MKSAVWQVEIKYLPREFTFGDIFDNIFSDADKNQQELIRTRCP